MEIIKREFNCKEMPLTVTYRCPKAVVAHAQRWVHHITADETAPDGEVTTMPLTIFEELGGEMLDAKSAVLCRNTAPLVDTAFKLIKRGIPCHVEGRDIGASLKALAGKWKITSLDKLRERLEKYLEKETSKFMAKGQEERAQAVADRVQTLYVIIDSLPLGSMVSDLMSQVDKLFGDVKEGQPSPNLTLSTVHKAKGREWDRVYLYCRSQYMPSKYARQAWQVEQELNLIYVAVTRAKKQLIEVENVPAPKPQIVR
jgi:DNA helicase-2/ATP-dependent DNA helicase PcrA